MLSTYTLEEHKHRYAAWAASSAARVPIRFPLKAVDGKRFLEMVSLNALVDRPDRLPDPCAFDMEHAEWRQQLVAVMTKEGYSSDWATHGTAAKLINVYLKTLFVCGGYHAHGKVVGLHPPIDRVLLNALMVADVGGEAVEWRRLRNIGWSKFKSVDYQCAIDLVRQVMHGAPLWQIEQYWQGFRS